MRKNGGGLASLMLAVVVIYFLLPSWLAAPLNLFVSFVHEAGHSLACILTGGAVKGFVIEANGTGYAITAGGARALVIAGGYLGATLGGVALLRLNTDRKIRRYILEGLGLLVALFTLNYFHSTFTLVFGLAAGLSLGLLGWYAPAVVEYHVVNFLGLYVGMGALSDLQALVAIQQGAARVSASGMGHSNTDAEAMQAISGVPALVWALGWAALSAWLLYRAALKTATD